MVGMCEMYVTRSARFSACTTWLGTVYVDILCSGLEQMGPLLLVVMFEPSRIGKVPPPNRWQTQQYILLEVNGLAKIFLPRLSFVIATGSRKATRSGVLRGKPLHLSDQLGKFLPMLIVYKSIDSSFLYPPLCISTNPIIGLWHCYAPYKISPIKNLIKVFFF